MHKSIVTVTPTSVTHEYDRKDSNKKEKSSRNEIGNSHHVAKKRILQLALSYNTSCMHFAL